MEGSVTGLPTGPVTAAGDKLVQQVGPRLLQGQQHILQWRNDSVML
jgi:hypothetical protein